MSRTTTRPLCVCDRRRGDGGAPPARTRQNRRTWRCVFDHTQALGAFTPSCSSTTLVPNQPTNRAVWYYFGTKLGGGGS